MNAINSSESLISPLIGELVSFAEIKWFLDGPVVRDIGIRFSTRTAIIKLSDGAIWVNSPAPAQLETLKSIAFSFTVFTLAGCLEPLSVVATHRAQVGAAPSGSLAVVRYEKANKTDVVAVDFGTKSNWYQNAMATQRVIIDSGSRRTNAIAGCLTLEGADGER